VRLFQKPSRRRRRNSLILRGAERPDLAGEKQMISKRWNETQQSNL
jgi:hypothetical protein